MAQTRTHISKSLVFLSGSNFLQKIFSFGGFLLVARYMPLDEYGVFLLVLSFASPIISLASLGLSGVLETEIALARGDGNHARIKGIVKEYGLINIFGFILVSAVLIFLGYLGFSDKFFELPSYGNYLYVLGFLVVFQMSINYFGLILHSFERFKAVAVIQGIETFLRFIFIIGIFFFSDFTVLALLLGYTFSKLISAVISLFSSKDIFTIDLVAVSAEKGVLYFVASKHGKWVIIKNIIAQFRESISLWLVGIFINTSGIAVFNVASRVISFIPKVFPLEDIIKPIIAKKIQDIQFVSFMIKKARKYYVLYLGSSVVLVWVFMHVILTFFLPEYANDYLLFNILSLRLLFDALTIGQTALLFAYRRQKFLLYQFMVTFGMTMIMNVVLLYLFGLIGLFIGVVVNTFLAFAIREWYIKTKLRLSLIDITSYITFDSYDRTILQAIYRRIKKLVPFT